jgi:AraC family L-rhamnose operon regulatory protein RhaS
MSALANIPTFLDAEGVHYADTCDPLRLAVAENELEMHALARENYPGDPFPGDSLGEVRTVGYWDASRPQHWGLEWHRNEGVEFTYLARGSLGFAVDGTEYALKRGCLTITRPWQSHRVGLPHVDPSRLHWLILDVGVRRPNHRWVWPSWVVLSPNDLATLTRLLQYNENPVWQADLAIERTFEALSACSAAPKRAALESELRLRINELLLEVLRLLLEQQVQLDEQLTSTRRGVEVFLRDLGGMVDRTWTLEEMARACGLGRTQFCRHVQDLTNMSPMEYLTYCRLQLAAEMLKSSAGTSITDIAFATGFTSSQYLAQQFRRYFRTTPTDYRRATQE